MKAEHKIKRMIERLHKKHQLHHRTIFYMRKGRKIHFHSRIISESIRILIIASVVSALGGIGLEAVQDKLVFFLPLLIVVPALNDMIGDFGTIVSSRFTTDLYLGKISRTWWASKSVNSLLKSVMIISFLSAIYISYLAAIMSLYTGFELTLALFFKTVLISVAATIILVGIIFFISVIGGLYIYSRKKDPNNFLIPITTSVADLGSMIIFSLLVTLLV